MFAYYKLRDESVKKSLATDSCSRVLKCKVFEAVMGGERLGTTCAALLESANIDVTSVKTYME